MDMFSLKGKVALITGAWHGIGLEMGCALAKAGAQITFNTRTQDKAEKGVAAYKAAGVEAKGYVCDVTDSRQAAKIVDDIETELGGVDILVNNAGIIKRLPMLEMDVADFREVIDIDLVGPFIMAKAVLPSMVKKRAGKIINLCSMMSELGRETVAA